LYKGEINDKGLVERVCPKDSFRSCSSETQAGSVNCMVAENKYKGWNGKVLYCTSVAPFLKMGVGDKGSLGFSLLYITDDF
jgi:hypothetical protein